MKISFRHLRCALIILLCLFTVIAYALIFIIAFEMYDEMYPVKVTFPFGISFQIKL